MPSIVQKSFPITIFFCLLLFKSVTYSDYYSGYTLYRCVSPFNETSVNLEPLFNNLAAAASSNSSSYYNTTIGKPPHKSYGMYLCRGDATSEVCSSCVANTTVNALSFDFAANCTDFVAFADYCTLRYANYSFFGKANDADLGNQPAHSFSNLSQDYKRSIVSAVERVTTEAPRNGTSLFAITEEAVDHESEKVYALAQCTPDISRGECNGCLKTAQAQLLNTTETFKGDWALLPSCQIRYDNASFSGGSTEATSNAPAAHLVAFLVIVFSGFINGLL